MPAWLHRLPERPSWLWSAGVALIVTLTVLRVLLHR